MYRPGSAPFALLGTALLGTLALAGCVTPQARLDAAEGAVEQRLADTRGGGSVAAPLARAGDFRGALRLAVDGNDAVRAARFTEAEALAGIAVAESGLRPQLTGSTLAGGVYEGDPSDQTLTGAAVDVMLTQLIYDGGASRAAMDEATARAIAARAKRLEIGNTTALAAYRAWSGLWLAQQRLALIRARMADLAVIMDQLGRMTESGMIDTSLRDGARLADIDIRSEESRLQADLAIAEAEFARYFGQASGALAKPAALFSAAELAAAPTAWQDAPALRSAAAGLLAAEAAVAGAQAARKPTVALNAGVASPMDREDTTDTSVGLQLRYTLGDGGRRKAQIAAAEARRDALRASLADAQGQARATMAAAQAKLAALERASALTAERTTASAAKADTVAAQIALGQSDLNGLMTAQIGTYRAEEQALQLAADRLVLQAEIAAGTGQLLARLGIAD